MQMDKRDWWVGRTPLGLQLEVILKTQNIIPQ